MCAFERSEKGMEFIMSEHKKEKFDFKKRKENTVASLFEVEHFLCNFKNVVKGIKLYQILK